MNQIKIKRMQKGYTIKKLAQLSHISPGYLCHLENGTRSNPSMETMEKIAKALNIGIAELFLLQ